MNKEEVEEIVTTYPQEIICHPRGSFEEQLRKHLCKHFKVEYRPQINIAKKEEKKEKKK